MVLRSSQSESAAAVLLDARAMLPPARPAGLARHHEAEHHRIVHGERGVDEHRAVVGRGMRR